MIEINVNRQPMLYLRSSPPPSITPSENNTLAKKIFQKIEEFKIGDHRGDGEKYLKRSSSAISALRTLTKIVWFILQSGLFFEISDGPIGHAIRGINKGICFSGLAICALDAVIEISGLFSQIQFLKSTQPTNLKTLKSIICIQDPLKQREKITEYLKKYSYTPLCLEIDEIANTPSLTHEAFFQRFHRGKEKIENCVLLSKLERIDQTYFQVSPETVAKIDRYMEKNCSDLSQEQQQMRKDSIIAHHLMRSKEILSERVRPWLANEIEQQIKPLITALSSENAEIRQQARLSAQALFSKMDMQIKKALITHVVGLIAIALSVTGLIASIAVCPLPISLTFILIGTVIGFVHYCMEKGWLNSRDWKFIPKECVPKWICSLWQRFSSSVKQGVFQIRPQKTEQLV